MIVRRIHPRTSLSRRRSTTPQMGAALAQRVAAATNSSLVVASSSIETPRVIALRSPLPLYQRTRTETLSLYLSVCTVTPPGLRYRALITEHPLFASAHTTLRCDGALWNGCCSSDRNFPFARRVGTPITSLRRNNEKPSAKATVSNIEEAMQCDTADSIATLAPRDILFSRGNKRGTSAPCRALIKRAVRRHQRLLYTRTLHRIGLTQPLRNKK